MKRQSFMLSGAGALLAGCAAPAVPTGSLIGSSTQPAVRRPDGNSDEVLLGSLMLVPYDFVPEHFEACAGQTIPIGSNPALYSLIGNKFGGDQQRDFGLPDMRKHAPIKGLTYIIAMRGIYPRRGGLEPHYYGTLPLLGQLTCVAYIPKFVPPPGWDVSRSAAQHQQKHRTLQPAGPQIWRGRPDDVRPTRPTRARTPKGRFVRHRPKRQVPFGTLTH